MYICTYIYSDMLSLRPTILLFTLILLVAVVFVAADDINTTPPSEEDDNSSSEETVEDSNEPRQKRSLETTSVETNNKGEDGKMMGRASIPGLPDPSTILKIAEILQALGEKIVPILVEGNSAASLVAEKVGKDYRFFKNFKRELDSLTDELKSK